MSHCLSSHKSDLHKVFKVIILPIKGFHKNNPIIRSLRQIISHNRRSLKNNPLVGGLKNIIPFMWGFQNIIPQLGGLQKAITPYWGVFKIIILLHGRPLTHNIPLYRRSSTNNICSVPKHQRLGILNMIFTNNLISLRNEFRYKIKLKQVTQNIQEIYHFINTLQEWVATD